MILYYCVVALIVLSHAQLDLPPTSSVRPNSYVSSQSFRNNQDGNPGDEDRSTRSGPPYSSLEDDEPQNRDGRVLSSGGSFNESANSPYTDRNSYYDRNYGYNNNNDRYNNDRYNNDLDRNRYSTDERNRYYVDERDRERNYNRFNDDSNRYYNRNPYDNRNRYDNKNRNTYDDRNNNNQDIRNNNPYDNPYYDRNRNPYDGHNRNPYDRNNNRNPYSNGGVYVDERDRDRNLNRGNVFGDDRNRYEQDYRYQQEMEKLRNFLSEIDHKGSEECTENVAAQWDFETNVNDHTSTSALAAQQHYAEFLHITHDQSKQIDRNLIFDESLLRQLNIISQTGPNALPIDQQDRVSDHIIPIAYRVINSLKI
ncbi:Ance-3.2 family protein [Megaselia abdita]